MPLGGSDAQYQADLLEHEISVCGTAVVRGRAICERGVTNRGYGDYREGFVLGAWWIEFVAVRVGGTEDYNCRRVDSCKI